jgi:hypothetical protein
MIFGRKLSHAWWNDPCAQAPSWPLSPPSPGRLCCQTFSCSLLLLLLLLLSHDGGWFDLAPQAPVGPAWARHLDGSTDPRSKVRAPKRDTKKIFNLKKLKRSTPQLLQYTFTTQDRGVLRTERNAGSGPNLRFLASCNSCVGHCRAVCGGPSFSATHLCGHEGREQELVPLSELTNEGSCSTFTRF